MIADIEHADTLVTSVWDLDQRSSVALGGMVSTEDVKIGRKFDFAFRIARCEIDVGNNSIGWQFGIDGEIDLPGDAVVAGFFGSFSDVNACDCGEGGRGNQERGKKAAGHSSHFMRERGWL